MLNMHLSSSSGYLPLGRYKCPTITLFSMLCLFLDFSISIFHHPVHELLSRPSSSSLPLHCLHCIYAECFCFGSTFIIAHSPHLASCVAFSLQLTSGSMTST